jgi:hypothetical protein
MSTTKPLAKSLHTVTVLVRVAIHLKRSNPELRDETALVYSALDILGLSGQLDTHRLAAQAIKQLNKFS